MFNFPMKTLIQFVFEKNRATIFIFILLCIIGVQSYTSLPKEAAPDVQIPFAFVQTSLHGISPIDAEHYLAKPMEDILKSIEGVKEMRSVSQEGMAQVILEFDSGYPINKALSDIRDKLDDITDKIPKDAKTPKVDEINLGTMPILYIGLLGDLPEKTMLYTAKNLQRLLETLPNILHVNIVGNRKERIEIIINPHMLEYYNLDIYKVSQTIAQNNVLIPAGRMSFDVSQYSVSIPNSIKNIMDVMNMPITSHEHSIITLQDIAEVRNTFEDRAQITRINGQPCMMLEISKRSGTNMLNIVSEIKTLLGKYDNLIPENMHLLYSRDQSRNVHNIIQDLENNIIFSIILVMIMISCFIGMRASLLISLAIPGSFLIGLSIIDYLGFTLNIVVLFSLILSVGMLVDASIVISEYADRKMITGSNKEIAFKEASIQMFWPIISSTVTTIAVFIPLIFWPGLVGQFMQYLPYSVTATLTGSVLMALIFIPIIGKSIGKPSSIKNLHKIHAIENGDVDQLQGIFKIYSKMLHFILSYPATFAISIVLSLIFTIYLYSVCGKGVEFFPNVEAEFAHIIIRSKDTNISLKEQDSLIRQVEQEVMKFNKEIEVIYTSVGKLNTSMQTPKDTIGIIQLEFVNWQSRRKAEIILQEIKENLAYIPGIILNVSSEKKGPNNGKPIQISLLSHDINALYNMHDLLLKVIYDTEGLQNISNGSDNHTIEWQLIVDQHKAMYHNLDTFSVGNMIKTMTSTGVLLSKYRSEEAQEEIDIVARLPIKYRDSKYFDSLTVLTPNAALPLAHFVNKKLHKRITHINRVDGMRAINISSDILSNFLVNEIIKEIQNKIEKLHWDKTVFIKILGESKDQEETSSFLKKAFFIAITSIILILTLEFNSMYHTFVTMTAIFLSSTGVLIGLLLTNQTFGIVMCGVGIIALSGIVVNNNILLIEAYNKYNNLTSERENIKLAIIRASVSRLKPILLTSGTTVLGLIPMISTINIDFFSFNVTYGAPSSQWWQQLSTTIAGGLMFSTILTLFFTPSLLLIGKKISKLRTRD